MDIEKLEMELDRLRELIEETERQLEVLDQLLGPYWYAKQDVEHVIKQTHGRRADGALIFHGARAEVRAPLFERLMQLAEEWGPVRTDRARVKSRLAGYELELKRRKNDLTYLRRKEAKREQGQGRLL